MPFLERIVVGCVIPDKNTLNKNKLSRVGGNNWSLCSVWIAVSKSLQLEPFPMLSMLPDRSCWGAVAKVAVRPGGATKKVRHSQIPRRWDLTPPPQHPETSLSSFGKWGCHCPSGIGSLFLMDSGARGPGSDLHPLCDLVTSLLYASLSLCARHG